MKCPICKLENPTDTVKCDCGYNFQYCRLEEPTKTSNDDQVAEAETEEWMTETHIILLVVALFGLLVLGVIIANNLNKF
jgi:hypothetical protein